MARRSRLEPNSPPTSGGGEFTSVVPIAPVEANAQNTPLLTNDDIRLEMARVYRMGKSGKLPQGTVSAMVWQLAQIGREIERALLETEVAELLKIASEIRK